MDKKVNVFKEQTRHFKALKLKGERGAFNVEEESKSRKNRKVLPTEVKNAQGGNVFEMEDYYHG